MLSVVMTILFITMGFAPEAFAKLPEKTSYTVLFSAQEETNIDVLFEKYRQNFQDRSVTAKAAFEEYTVEGNEISQLLEVRQYDDGHVEKDYVSTAFEAVENGMAAALSGKDHLDEVTKGGYDIVTVTQVSYTSGWSGTQASYTYHFIRAKLTYKSPLKTASVTLGFDYQVDWGSQQYVVPSEITTNATVNYWYTWDFGANGMTIKTHEMMGGAGAFAKFTTSGAGTPNGTITVEMKLKRADIV